MPAARRSLKTSPNRRRELARVAVWVAFTGAAAVLIPLLALHA